MFHSVQEAATPFRPNLPVVPTVCACHGQSCLSSSLRLSLSLHLSLAFCPLRAASGQSTLDQSEVRLMTPHGKDADMVFSRIIAGHAASYKPLAPSTAPARISQRRALRYSCTCTRPIVSRIATYPRHATIVLSPAIYLPLLSLLHALLWGMSACCPHRAYHICPPPGSWSPLLWLERFQMGRSCSGLIRTQDAHNSPRHDDSPFGAGAAGVCGVSRQRLHHSRSLDIRCSLTRSPGSYGHHPDQNTPILDVRC